MRLRFFYRNAEATFPPVIKASEYFFRRRRTKSTTSEQTGVEEEGLGGIGGGGVEGWEEGRGWGGCVGGLIDFLLFICRKSERADQTSAAAGE